MPDPALLEKPDIVRLPDAEIGYACTWPTSAVRVELTRIIDKRDDLRAEATIIRCRAGQDPRLLYEGEMNLKSLTIRRQVVKYLVEERHQDDLDWHELFEVLCYEVKRDYRLGTPAVHVRDIQEDTRPRFALRPYLEYGRPTIIFGPGSSGKTFSATAAACSLSTGLPIWGDPVADPMPVMYIDYETDARVWKRRVLAVMRGLDRLDGGVDMPDVYHRKPFGPFVEHAAAILAECKRLGVGFLVIDSMLKALGGELIDPHFVGPFFDAVDRFQMPTLIVAHVDKEAVKHDGNGHLMPWGTAFHENSAGNTFSFRNRAPEGSATSDIFIRHEKTNEGTKVADHGYNLTFENFPEPNEDMTRLVRFERQDGRDMVAFRDKLPLGQRITLYLEQAPQCRDTVQNICAAFPDDTKGSISGTLTQLVQRGKIVPISRGVYGAASKREAV